MSSWGHNDTHLIASLKTTPNIGSVVSGLGIMQMHSQSVPPVQVFRGYIQMSPIQVLTQSGRSSTYWEKLV